MIRPATDADTDGVIALIGRCWSDYPGAILDVDGEEPWMRAPASYYRNCGGQLWVTDGVHGMVGTRPVEQAEWEICRMYVHPDHHGTGLAHTLLDHAEAYAEAQGARRLILWTDTRFIRAHRFYERRGYVRFGQVRALHDLSNTHEFAYASPSPSGR